MAGRRSALREASAARRVKGNADMTQTSPWAAHSRIAQTGRLYIGHLEDFIALAAARRGHLDAIARLLADQRARGRRGDRHFARLHVRLALADELKLPLFFGVFVDQRDGRAELDRRPVQ